MNYNILNTKAPRVPVLGRGPECIKLLCSQALNDMVEPLIPMLFPVLGAHISNTEFLFPDQSWKQPCGMMANLVAESGGNKGQLTALVEAICRNFRVHDEEEISRLVEWQREMKKQICPNQLNTSGADTELQRWNCIFCLFSLDAEDGAGH